MDIAAAFPSQFLKAADLQGKSWRMQIRSCAIEDIGDDRKPILHFERSEKGLVLNKTNAFAIAAAYGQNTDGWIGKPLDVFPDSTMYQGRPTPCVRVKPVLQQANPVAPPMTPPAAAPAPGYVTMEQRGAVPDLADDDIPF